MDFPEYSECLRSQVSEQVRQDFSNYQQLKSLQTYLFVGFLIKDGVQGEGGNWDPGWVCSETYCVIPSPFLWFLGFGNGTLWNLSRNFLEKKLKREDEGTGAFFLGHREDPPHTPPWRSHKIWILTNLENHRNPYPSWTCQFCGFCALFKGWWVSSRDPKSKVVNVTNPTFGDKWVTAWITWYHFLLGNCVLWLFFYG